MTEANKFVSESLLQFTTEFYQHICESQNEKLENVFFSPLSLHIALSMTLHGTDGTTRDELVKALKIPAELRDKNLAAVFGSRQMSLLNSEGVQVFLANSLFLDSKFVVKSLYIDALKAHYKSITEYVDFSNNPKRSCEMINDWVSKNTNQMIHELVSEDSMDKETVLFLINAIFFKGMWENQFMTWNTLEEDFHLLEGETMMIKMMRDEDTYKWVDLPSMDATAIKLPYKSSRWELVIVLPNQNNGLPQLMQQITQPGSLQQLCQKRFLSKKLELILPRFKLYNLKSINVKKALQAMGAEQVFTSKANFSKMIDEIVYVSNVIHKAVIEVDEVGTRAVAATAVEMLCGCAPILPTPAPEFRVDHPFVLAIICNDTVPVFLGHVIKPEEL